MYVLIVARNYPMENSPLRGIFEFDQAKALLQAGVKVVLLSIDLRSIRRRRKLGKTHLTKDGIEIYNIALPLGIAPSWLFRLVGRIALRLIYSDILRHHGKPDLVHAHFTDIAAVASWFKTKHHLPFIVTEHSSKINTDQPAKKTISYGKIAYAAADKIIAVSAHLAKRLKQHFNVDGIVIHNIVETETFKYEPKPHENFTFISVGSLIPVKGFDILLEAFSRLELADTRLIIVGEGPERLKIISGIDELNLQGKVLLAGRKTRSEINDLMAHSDVFALASLRETFGVVYIEAMAAGLPVIATQCGGPEDFMNENTGILVPVDDVDELAKAMIYMHDNKSLFNSERISQQCRQLFSPETIAEQLTLVYKKVMNTHIITYAQN